MRENRGMSATPRLLDTVEFETGPSPESVKQAS